MGLGTALARVFDRITKAVEGEYRPGPYHLPVTGGTLSAEAGQWTNFWQLGYDVNGTGRSAMVEACVSAYSQTVAMCSGDHWRANDKGGRDRVKNSALARFLRKPNGYQSISDFMLNATRSLYLTGNAYALALRNDRYEIDSLHLMDPSQSRAHVAATGDVFYQLSGNDIIAQQIDGPLVIPQRDVLHIRLHADRRYPFPLRGESPLVSALADIGMASAILDQQQQFYQNQARPSAVLSTDLVLDKDQVQALRDRWDDQSRGMKAGGVPILTAGLKVQPWTQTARDAQLAEVMKISEQHIALAFRIPLQILGLGSGTPYSSTELLMQSWVAQGLGFALNHIEEAFGLLFNLKGVPEEYCEFDTAALLRSAKKDRIEALARAVQGGIFSPNEARAEEGLDAADHGDEPRVQQQVVPLSFAAAVPSPAGGIPAAPGQPGPPAPPSAAGPQGEEPEPEESEPEEKPKPKPKKSSANGIRRAHGNILGAAERIGRRRLS